MTGVQTCALPISTSFVICWSNGTGGTEQALRIATAERIPITNLFSAESREDAEKWLAGAPIELGQKLR